jgi:GxxExxY protein
LIKTLCDFAPSWQKNSKYMIDERTEEIAKIIVDSAFKVHKNLGPGLLERVYEVCLAYEINKAGLNVQSQMEVPIIYDGVTLKEKLRLDLIVENTVIVEVKAVDTVNPVWQAQIISHLKLTDNQLGFLINFNVPLIKNGIKRFINTR